MRSTVLIALLLLSLSGALSSIGPWGSFVYEGLAITLKGDSQTLVVETLRTNDTTQLWRYEDGLIVSKANSTLVFDVKYSRIAANTDVIAFPRNNQKNQWWTVNANSVQSLLATHFYLKLRTGSFQVVVDYFPTGCPPVFKFVEPVVGPLTCSSYGDPHITCWSGTKFDYQFIGTVNLAKFNNHVIQAVQGSCGPNFISGVTCNKGIAVKPYQSPDVVQIRWNGEVYVNGVLTTVASTLVVSTYITVKKFGPANYRIDVQGGYITTFDYNFYVTVLSGSIQPSLCACEGAVVENHEYGLSHTVQEIGDSIYTYSPSEPFVYDPSYQPYYGPLNITNDAYEACSPLQVGPLFDACHDFVNPTSYYDACLLDVSAGNDVEIADLAIAAYTVDCDEKARKNNTPVALPTSAAASTVSVPSNYTVLWHLSLSFTIQAKDATSTPRTTGGDVFVVTAVSGPTPLSFTVADWGNGTYLVTYSPGKVGTYVVNIKLNGQAVAGTPITINVLSAGNIIYNNLAVTFKGQGNPLTLETLLVNDNRQQWTFGADGFIVSKNSTTQVFDSKDGSTRANNPVVAWIKKTPVAANQQFTRNTTVGIRSLLINNANGLNNYYLKANGTQVVLDYVASPQNAQNFYYI